MYQKRVIAIFRKELIHIKRDPISLIEIILMPIILLFLYGFALTFDIKNVPMAVIDHNSTQLSHEFIERFANSNYFKLIHKIENYNQIYHLLDTSQIHLALVIPFNFSRDIKRGGSTKIQIILDGSDANTTNIILGYIQTIINNYNQKIIINRAHLQEPTKIKSFLQINPRIWYNEELKSQNFIVPGLVAIIMTMIGALLTSLCIVRETERGSIEGLIASPLLRSELILGKLGSYFIIGLIDMGIAMSIGHWLFQIPMHGSWILMIGASIFYLLAMLGQGLLISVIANNQLQANQLAMLTTFLPALLLSGFMFDIRQMPMFLQLFSYIIPAKYFVNITKNIYLKGLGLTYFWKDILLLITFAILFLSLAIHRFQKKIK